MNISSHLIIATPLMVTFVSAILSSFNDMGKRWQNYVIGLLGALMIFFFMAFLNFSPAVPSFNSSVFEVGLDKASLFIGLLFCGSLFVGLYPVRNQINLSSMFLYYMAGGLGVILANNLLTFFLFWSFQRALPIFGFVRDAYKEESSGGGTYVLQHLMTFLCLIALMILAFQQGVLFAPFSEIPASFFSWPVLFLSFVIIYESHGIFPFHSWIHDVIGKLSWYELSTLFLSRAGVLLFVKFLLPTFNQDPDIFKILLLSLSIISSIYWSFRGIFEINISKTVTYFYVAQTSLILTGLQANLSAQRGSFLHMMVISLAGTAMWSILNYIQHYFSIKRHNRFYGLAQFYPKLATLFCLFGFCMIGLPMLASFVVEDLVINGLLEKWPYLGLGHIFATCLAGILFFLVFTKLFMGMPSYRQEVRDMDMPLKEMIPYVIVLIVMILIGICPSIFLERINF